jgi:hypothetical protein
LLHRKTALRVAAPVAVLALSLTACGGGDDAPDAKAKQSTAQAAPSPTKAASGGKLATGESATGKVKEGDAEITYDITAQKVDIGTEAEAQALVQDKSEAKGMVLVVSHVKYTHKAGATLADRSDADDGTTIWADGKRGAVLIGAANDAAGCEDPYDVPSWKQGESHVFCDSDLIPANAKSVEVHWSEEDGEPYIWSFPNK